MTRYSIEPRARKYVIYYNMDFCHSEEIYPKSMEDN